jgi:hypothetical protein
MITFNFNLENILIYNIRMNSQSQLQQAQNRPYSQNVRSANANERRRKMMRRNNNSNSNNNSNIDDAAWEEAKMKARENMARVLAAAEVGAEAVGAVGKKIGNVSTKTVKRTYNVSKNVVSGTATLVAKIPTSLPIFPIPEEPSLDPIINIIPDAQVRERVIASMDTVLFRNVQKTDSSRLFQTLGSLAMSGVLTFGGFTSSGLMWRAATYILSSDATVANTFASVGLFPSLVSVCCADVTGKAIGAIAPRSWQQTYDEIVGSKLAAASAESKKLLLFGSLINRKIKENGINLQSLTAPCTWLKDVVCARITAAQRGNFKRAFSFSSVNPYYLQSVYYTIDTYDKHANTLKNLLDNRHDLMMKRVNSLVELYKLPEYSTLPNIQNVQKLLGITLQTLQENAAPDMYIRLVRPNPEFTVVKANNEYHNIIFGFTEADAFGSTKNIEICLNNRDIFDALKILVYALNQDLEECKRISEAARNTRTEIKRRGITDLQRKLESRMVNLTEYLSQAQFSYDQDEVKAVYKSRDDIAKVLVELAKPLVGGRAILPAPTPDNYSTKLGFLLNVACQSKSFQRPYNGFLNNKPAIDHLFAGFAQALRNITTPEEVRRIVDTVEGFDTGIIKSDAGEIDMAILTMRCPALRGFIKQDRINELLNIPAGPPSPAPVTGMARIPLIGRLFSRNNKGKAVKTPARVNMGTMMNTSVATNVRRNAAANAPRVANAPANAPRAANAATNVRRNNAAANAPRAANQPIMASCDALLSDTTMTLLDDTVNHGSPQIREMSNRLSTEYNEICRLYRANVRISADATFRQRVEAFNAGIEALRRELAAVAATAPVVSMEPVVAPELVPEAPVTTTRSSGRRTSRRGVTVSEPSTSAAHAAMNNNSQQRGGDVKKLLKKIEEQTAKLIEKAPVQKKHLNLLTEKFMAKYKSVIGESKEMKQKVQKSIKKVFEKKL